LDSSLKNLCSNRCYELFLIFSMKLSEEERKVLVRKFSKIIESDGKIDSVDEWGKRKLVYLIKKEREGIYVLINFKAGNSVPSEINRVAMMTEGVLRSLVVAN